MWVSKWKCKSVIAFVCISCKNDTHYQSYKENDRKYANTKAATISNILCRLIEHDQYLCENKIDKKNTFTDFGYLYSVSKQIINCDYSSRNNNNNNEIQFHLNYNKIIKSQ